MAVVDRLRFTPRKHERIRVGTHTVIYTPSNPPQEQQEKSPVETPAFLASFFLREDVSYMLPYLSQRRRVYMEHKQVEGRDGAAQSYLVLKQGKRRFIFNEQESSAADSETSDEQRQKRLSMTLVVPQKTMQEKGLLPADGEHFRRFRNIWDRKRFLRTVEHEGYFATRGDPTDPSSFENNTTFIQPIPAGVVRDQSPRGDNILFSVRGSENHDERLQGMIVAPFTMGHSEIGDFGFWRRFQRHGLNLAMLREAAEETMLQRGQETFHVFPTKNGHDYNVTLRGILQLRRYYRIRPLGVVYEQDMPVDKVHAGIIFEMTPTQRAKKEGVAITLNGHSREVNRVVSMSTSKYREATDPERIKPNQKPLIPASWNRTILKALEDTRRPSRLRQARAILKTV